MSEPKFPLEAMGMEAGAMSKSTQLYHVEKISYGVFKPHSTYASFAVAIDHAQKLKGVLRISKITYVDGKLVHSAELWHSSPATKKPIERSKRL